MESMNKNNSRINALSEIDFPEGFHCRQKKRNCVQDEVWEHIPYVMYGVDMISMSYMKATSKHKTIHSVYFISCKYTKNKEPL